MSYQQVKCPRGHSFMATVYSRHQRITCPDSERNARDVQARSDDPIFQSPADPGFSPSFNVSESDTFRSGGGGDFGGGGASGGWDSGGSSSSDSGSSYSSGSDSGFSSSSDSGSSSSGSELVKALIDIEQLALVAEKLHARDARAALRKIALMTDAAVEKLKESK